MGNTRKFEIQIPSGQTVFYPGQVIQGQVCVDITESMRIRGITISCISLSEVTWRARKRTVYGSESYLNLKLTLYGNPPPDGENVILAAGNHMFPFHFVLPVNLPGSYEGEYGCFVRHWMKAVIDRPFKFNKEFKMVFTVASILDLNAIQDAATPILCQNSQSICCCCRCCNHGEVTANFRLEKRGFVPGESVAIFGVVKDGANAGINGVNVLFMRRTYYTAASGAVMEQKVQIGKLHHNKVSPGGSDIWSGDKIRIPPIPPSYLVGCAIIDIQYFIEVRVHLPSCFNDLRFVLPIIIGTVPLHATVQQFAGRSWPTGIYPNASNDPRTVTQQPQGASAPPLAAPVGNLELPPPSYQECVFGKVDTNRPEEKYTAGNTKFAPSYTYYDDFV